MSDITNPNQPDISDVFAIAVKIINYAIGHIS